MKILFIRTTSAGGERSANRTHEHCRRWVQDGHEVTVLTGVPNHPRGVVFDGYENRVLGRDDRRDPRPPDLDVPHAEFGLREAGRQLSGLHDHRDPRLLSRRPPRSRRRDQPAVLRRRRRRDRLETEALPLRPRDRDLWPKSVVELGQLGPGPISELEALERWLYPERCLRRRQHPHLSRTHPGAGRPRRPDRAHLQRDRSDPLPTAPAERRLLSSTISRATSPSPTSARSDSRTGSRC